DRGTRETILFALARRCLPRDRRISAQQFRNPSLPSRPIRISHQTAIEKLEPPASRLHHRPLSRTRHRREQGQIVAHIAPKIPNQEPLVPLQRDSLHWIETAQKHAKCRALNGRIVGDKVAAAVATEKKRTVTSRKRHL